MSETSALATITVGLRTRSRPVGLIQVADAISELTELYGSQAKVADRAMVSVGMIRKFLTVNRLSPRVRALVERREIDRVMDAFWLSKVRDRSTQLRLAKAISENRLKTAELRDTVAILRRDPGAGADAALNRVVSGRKRIERAFAVAMPLKPETRIPHSDVEAAEALRAFAPNSGVAVRGNLLVAFFTPRQLNAARRAAKSLHVDLTDLADHIFAEADA